MSRTFVYTGEEGTEAFGLRFPFNEPVIVENEHAIRKLSGNRFFVEVVDGVEIVDPIVQPKRRGRPPKAK